MGIYNTNNGESGGKETARKTPGDFNILGGRLSWAAF